MQATPGIVFHRGNLSAPNTAADLSTRGTGFGWDLIIGGRITRNIVLGGMLSYHDVEVSLTNNNTGTEPGKTDIDYSAVSVAGLWYPMGEFGLNVQAALGLASYDLEDLELRNVSTPNGRATYPVDALSGAHFMLGVGYDIAVEDNWGLGLVARMEFATISQKDEPKTEGTMFTPSLRLAFTYH